MGRVVIGMDPHKRSATIEIINSREKALVSAVTSRSEKTKMEALRCLK